MNRCASIKTLMQLKDVDLALAKEIRRVWRTVKTREELMLIAGLVGSDFYHDPPVRHLKRVAVDKLIGTYGVEFLGLHRKSKDDMYYCNAGETYAETIIFKGHTLSVGCWGDWVESNKISPLTEVDLIS